MAPQCVFGPRPYRLCVVEVAGVAQLARLLRHRGHPRGRAGHILLAPCWCHRVLPLGQDVNQGMSYQPVESKSRRRPYFYTTQCACPDALSLMELRSSTEQFDPSSLELHRIM